MTTPANSSPVAIIGGGTMGRNIALLPLLRGETVHLCETSATARAGIPAHLQAAVDLMSRHGLPVPAADWEKRLVLHGSLPEAVAGVELAIEAIPEDLDAKRTLFGELERHCRADTVLASNTSGFLPSSLAAGLKHPERLLVAHFWNPAHLVPLVELVPHAGTDAVVVEGVQRRLRAWGKKVVALNNQIEGFIGNRLAFAMHREAMDLVERGIATPDEIDAVVQYGFGRRLPASGVFGTADLGGLDVYLSICNNLFPDLCGIHTAPQGLVRLVEQNRLGVKTRAGWRTYDEQSAAALQSAVAEELFRHARKDLESPGVNGDRV